MKKFLIKETAVGTKDNPNFAGVVNHYYFGKGHASNIGRTVFESDYAPDAEYFKDRAIYHLAREYGYSSEAACKTAIAAEMKHRNEEAARYGFHTFSCEVFAVEVA